MSPAIKKAPKRSHKGSRPTVKRRCEQLKRGLVASADVVESTGYSASTVHRWMDAGKLDGEIVGGRRWINLVSLEAHLGAQQVKQVLEDMAEDGVS